MFKESFNPYQDFNIKKDNYKRKQEIDEELKLEREQQDKQAMHKHEAAKESLIKETLAQIKDFQKRQTEAQDTARNKDNPERPIENKTASKKESHTEFKNQTDNYKEFRHDYKANDELKISKIKYNRLTNELKEKLDVAMRNIRIKFHPDKIIGQDQISQSRRIKNEKIIQVLSDLHQTDVMEFIKQAKRLGENIDTKNRP